VERVGVILHGQTHPPPEERLVICHATLDQRYGPDAAALRAATQQTSELLDRLGSAALAVRERQCTSAARRMAEIFGSPPRSAYDRDAKLLQEVLGLMNAAPSVVVPALADNLLTADGYVRAAAARDYEESDALRRHQLAHFFARHATHQVQQVLGVTAM
jgi:hypothetical protein